MSKYFHKGQIVVGYPGSGKTSYCYSFRKILISNLKNPILINLDPGNDSNTFFFEINICTMISTSEITSELHLGPNGSIMYSIEYFEKNIDWFEKRLQKIFRIPLNFYFLFDFPGQVELYTHQRIINKLIQRIKNNQINLVTVSLIDSIYSGDIENFIFVFLISILIMLNLELSFIGLFSKIDLITYKNKNNKKSIINYKFRI